MVLWKPVKPNSVLEKDENLDLESLFEEYFKSHDERNSVLHIDLEKVVECFNIVHPFEDVEGKFSKEPNSMCSLRGEG